MANVKMELNDRECSMIKEGLKVKVASLSRYYNNADDVELKNVFSRQIQEYTDLARKFP